MRCFMICLGVSIEANLWYIFDEVSTFIEEGLCTANVNASPFLWLGISTYGEKGT